ncbi:MAG: universal stress protein [Paracoccaceae bacterium]|nr:universal stress protein [Paracoccaceae bacterium]
MHQHILIPVAPDHEGLAARKLKVARTLLAEGGRITLLTVLEEVPAFQSDFFGAKAEADLAVRVRERLENAAGGARDIDIAVSKGKPGVRVAEFAREDDVDLIIVGSHAPGIEDYFLGSTAARVARRAPCSVYILR